MRFFETYDPVMVNISNLSHGEIARQLNSIAIISDRVGSRYFTHPERGNKIFVVAVLYDNQRGEVALVTEQRCRDSNEDVIVTAGSWSAETVEEFLEGK